MTWWHTLGLALLAVIGVWRFFAGKANRWRQRAAAAGQLGREGVHERDPSKITISADRLNRP